MKTDTTADQDQQTSRSTQECNHETPRNRPAIARMAQILQRLQERRTITAAKLAKAFEYSQKTLHRDLDFMRERLGIPIVYSSSLRSWYLDDHGKWGMSPKTLELVLRALPLTDELKHLENAEWQEEVDYDDEWGRLLDYADGYMDHVLVEQLNEGGATFSSTPRAKRRGIVKG